MGIAVDGLLDAVSEKVVSWSVGVKGLIAGFVFVGPVPDFPIQQEPKT